MAWNIVLVDDHIIMREGLRKMLESKLGFHVVGEANTGNEAIEMAQKLHPDLMIMDITMPDINGVEATRKIHQLFPGIKIIALSMHSEKKFVTEMLTVGATGYLLKESGFDELYRAINAVMANRSYVSPEIAGIVVTGRNLNHSSSDFSDIEILTEKERDVLRLIAEGYSTKNIAARLNVSSKTIDSHRQNIMEKLQLFSIAELTKFAIRNGLTTVEK